MVDFIITYEHMTGTAPTEAYPVIADCDDLEKIFDFYQGSAMVVQSPQKDCSGKYYKIFVDDIYYYPTKRESFIIVKCEFADSLMLSDKSKIGNRIFISSPLRQNLNLDYTLRIKHKVPEIIKNKSEFLKKEFFPDQFEILDEPKAFFQPLRFQTPCHEEMYYAVVLSYGNKPRKGVIYLLNKKAEVIQKITNSIRSDYHKIKGVTDTNLNGSHELVIYCGNSYGNALVVFELIMIENQVKLSFRNKIITGFD
jgi:hypothetical protein